MATSRPAPAPSSDPSSTALVLPFVSAEANADENRTKAYGDEGERTVCSVRETSVDELPPAVELDTDAAGSAGKVPR